MYDKANTEPRVDSYDNPQTFAAASAPAPAAAAPRAVRRLTIDKAENGFTVICDHDDGETTKKVFPSAGELQQYIGAVFGEANEVPLGDGSVQMSRPMPTTRSAMTE